jgi:hypothetical protein
MSYPQNQQQQPMQDEAARPSPADQFINNQDTNDRAAGTVPILLFSTPLLTHTIP